MAPISSKRFAVYLAGGMHSTWQDLVMARVPGCTYLDPRQHGLVRPAAYTAWDMRAIRSSDIVFAYLASDNPSGFGLAFELGYARALGKYVIFVNEREADMRLGMLTASADFCTSKLESGVRRLKRVVSS